ncbi:MAG: alpha-galactosidase [Bacilli bacterium]|nr:alpha-galactosidase [Bacilli bacterium]
MAIYVNDLTKEFHLQSLSTSYIFKVHESGHLIHLYYGDRLEDCSNFSFLYKNYSCETGSTVMYKKDLNYSMAHHLYEFPFYGKGDFREPAIDILLDDGSKMFDLKYDSYEIIDSKYEINGLPFSIGDNMQSLIIKLIDKKAKVTILLNYAIFEDANVITRNIKIINDGEDSIIINKIMSLNLDILDGDYEAITLDGAWVRERHITEHKIDNGVFYIDSKKGVSSSDHNPFICLKENSTFENSGKCYGFSLLYSGNHKFSIEKNPYDMIRVQCGINPFDFKWLLTSNNCFETPEAVMTFSSNGLNKMSQNFHSFVNNNIVRGPHKFNERPILINNWEATYFDFNTTKLLSIAKEAKNLGIELFVLDDGWFGHRNDDKSSLGDWYPNTKKIHGGIKRLSEQINKIGLKFGIWVEPEMISFDSNLYTEHPEWMIKHPNYDVSIARNQAVLDLANPSVIDYLFTSLAKLFSESNIEYVKWDMNRNLSDIYSNYLNKQQQGAYVHNYYLGLYSLLDKLTKRFPNILFEACASGGNRFDLGMLVYMQQIWCSDNNDPYERQLIQYGTSLLYPLSTIGAHVATNVNHQMFRKTPIESRFNVAAFGLLGYELDLTALSKFEKECIKNQIKFYKSNRQLFQYGTFYRIDNPFKGNNCSWMVISDDKKEAIYGNYIGLVKPNPKIDKLNIVGLNKDYLYNITTRTQYANIKTFGTMINHISPIKIKEDHLIQNVLDKFYMFKMETEYIDMTGDQLMKCGFFPKHQFTGTGYSKDVRVMGDFGSRIYKIVKKEE